ncbi:uncharacterized protein LOC143862957 [Tasmannia lanceolata]|uniref:uncharacterized protein LOC143859610 n=1 Tax=Tasmannia lanceolata TaxID=3420 RepID=UPI004063D23C
MKKMCSGWNISTNYNSFDRGRIWIIWNPNLVQVRILQEANQFMHCEVRFLQTNITLLVTSVYALNRGTERRVLWNHLSLIARSVSLPWIIMGDFNIIRFASEFLGGTGPSARDMEDFNSWIDECSVSDLRSFGQTLSWNNQSNENNWKFRRLDRVLVSEEWLYQYPSSFASYLHPGLSDHTPITIQLNQSPQIPKPPFKFFSMWLEDLSVFEVVERAWNIEIDGSPLFIVVKKLKEVKGSLKIWNREVFGRIDIEAPRLRLLLESTQEKIATSLTDQALRDEEVWIKDEYIRTARKEEAFYRQKSRSQWLNLGDSNTAFFHAAMKARKNQNCIQGTVTTEGSISTNPDEIAETMVEFFSSLLNKEESSQPVHPNSIPEPTRSLSEADSQWLTRKFSAGEIWDVIKNSDGNKSPGPGGFNGCFFQAFWYLIGPDIVKAIKFFFQRGKILPQLNATFLALLSKTPDASSPEKYRPISLCNFLYKVITKLLANRLKPIMDSLISPFELAFIKAFHIPKASLNNIEKILRNFIWAGSNLEKSHHPVSWNTICSPKSDEASGSERGRSLWTLPMPASPSWAARSIIKSRDMASKHVCFIVGTQTPLHFWTDPWHPNGPLSAQSSITTSFIPQKASIAEAKFQGGWDLNQVLPHLQELKQIINTGLYTKAANSNPIWKPESDGNFRLCSAWNAVRSPNPKPPWVSSVWFAGHTPKFSITAWQALQDKMSTRDNLHFLGPNHDRSCLLCNSASESVNHIFFNCSYSAWIWRLILRRISDRRKQKKSLSDEKNWIRSKFKKKGQTYTFVRTLLTASIYLIWQERNSRLFQKKNP